MDYSVHLEALPHSDIRDLLKLQLLLAGQRVTQLAVGKISKAMGGQSFRLGDISRTAETMLASLGFSSDLRGQLLSHGLGGVQNRHYDKHDYMPEKLKMLQAWKAFIA